jgi:hypothetical protein
MIYGDIGETADYMVTSYSTRSVSVSRSHIIIALLGFLLIQSFMGFTATSFPVYHSSVDLSNMFAVANYDDAHLNKQDIVIPVPKPM